ncbi:hypothetical protein EBO15_23675 [Actinomadura harenae]|uniref:Uncharacterized protein n=1 Tax=Actinomadura harenae TaxID=2483351 RepID=A0A3M2LUZ8_9ACTN|nr:hypothetical protein EBO15_23675 [Actinomadura harenae]
MAPRVLRVLRCLGLTRLGARRVLMAPVVVVLRVLRLPTLQALRRVGMVLRLVRPVPIHVCGARPSAERVVTWVALIPLGTRWVRVTL